MNPSACRNIVIRLQGQILHPALLLVLMLLSVSCSTIDERDECCEEVTIHFRYSKGSIDEFPHYIHSMDYFIFDSEGVLIEHHDRKRGERFDLQRLQLRDVKAGRYHLIAVGNASEWSDIFPIEVGRTRLSMLELEVSHYLERSDLVEESSFRKMGDSDPLYYGQLSYEVEPVYTPQEYLCDMSNAHARLIVTVRWVDSQPEDRTSPFLLELIGVPGYYTLSSPYRIGVSGEGPLESREDRVVHAFPHVMSDSSHPVVTHYKGAPYLAGRVRGEVRSLRYSDDLIPELRISQGGDEVMRSIPLKRVFQELKWDVSSNIEQLYELEFKLYDDGRVEVRAGGQLHTLDWFNGGTIG